VRSGGGGNRTRVRSSASAVSPPASMANGEVIQLRAHWLLGLRSQVLEHGADAAVRLGVDLEVKFREDLLTCGSTDRSVIKSRAAIALFEGLRISELFGLCWSTVDLNAEGAETLLLLEQVHKGSGSIAPRPRAARARFPCRRRRSQRFALSTLKDARARPAWSFPPRAVDPGTGATSTAAPGTRSARRPAYPDSTSTTFATSTSAASETPGSRAYSVSGFVGDSDERTHRGYTQPIEGTDALIRAALTRAFPTF
jgi:hypothetical protein